MAISWGSARETSTNGVRIGVDLTYTVSGATATIVFELWLWTKQASFGSSAEYSRSGNTWSGGGTFSYNHGTTTSSGWSTSNRTRIGRWTTTRTLQYGSTQTITAGGSVTNSTLGGNMPSGSTSHSRSVTLPARPVLSPLSPSGASVSRHSDSEHTVSWTRTSPDDPSRPYQSQRVQRRMRWAADGYPWSGWSTVATVSGGVSSWRDTGTEANREYQWRVQARNDGGDSGWAWTEPRATRPDSPRIVRLVPSLTGIRVEWDITARMPAWTRVEVSEGGAWFPGTRRGSTATDWVYPDPDPTKSHRFRLRHEAQDDFEIPSEWAYSETLQLAAPPAAPTNLGPSTPWDATEDRVWTHRHVPTDGSEQTRLQVRHRVQGGVWTTEPEVATEVEAWTLPGGTYANGDIIERQVRTWGVHPDPSPWSATQVTTPIGRPTVAINRPEPDELVETSSLLAEWSFDQAQGGAQSAWRLTLEADGQVVQERSGSGATSAFELRHLEDGAEYTLTAQVQSGGLWSEPDTVSFTVAYLSPEAPTIERVTWDPDTGAAVVELTQPVWDENHAEPAHHQLWRAIDDGPWLLIADDIPLSTAITDPIPAIGDGHVNYYRAVTVSVLPSTADSEVVTLTVPSVGKGGTQGWVYLNGGPGMTQVCRVRANAERADNEGVAHTVRHFAGRLDPVAYFGTARTLTWDVSARIAPDFDGASTRDELVALQAAGTPICYRDPTGARWFGVMGPISSSWRSIIGEVSFSFTRVDAVEGLDVVQRLPGELEPAL